MSARREALPRRRFDRPAIGLLLGPAIAVAMLAGAPPEGMTPEGWRTAAVGALMAIWWISEAIPISATALVPLVLFPLLGILPIGRAAPPYAHPIIFLFLGGFILAAGIEKSGLHRRLALAILARVGTRPRSLVAGFMFATAFMSMWVSNTATVVMMLPMVLSVIALTEREAHRDEPFAVALLLSVAYAASIGGLGTLIGTPPNALLAGFVSETYGIEIRFVDWMLFGVPFVAVALPLTWLVVTRAVFHLGDDPIAGGRSMIEQERRALGRISRAEITVASIAGITALAWVTQPLLAAIVPAVSDAGIAIGGALLMFLVPVRWREREFPLEWNDVERLPWGVLILFGGGLSLASAIEQTRLAEWMAGSISALGTVPLVVTIVAVTAIVIFLTELTSNTATAAAFLPLVASVGTGFGYHPLSLAIPAVLAASCAFMLPVATPPNALVYASGHVTVPQMARAGIWLNLLFLLLITVAVVVLAPLALGFAVRP